MQRFKNVLIMASQGVDHTQLMRSAEHLAVTNQARLTVFDAVPPLRSRRTGIAGYRSEDLQQLIESDRRSELEAIAQLAPNVTVDVDVITGTPYIEAIRRVVSHGHDLVMVIPDQPGGLVGLARASTTMHLLRKSPVPVWVFRPEVPSDGDVLTAVGPFEEGRPSSLDVKLVQLGRSLAERRGSRFHLVHGWRLEGESLLRNSRVGMPADEVDELVSREEALARSGVMALLEDAGISEHEALLHLIKGKPVDAISDVAAEVDPGVVIMGSLARTGVAGMLIGNTAETTLGSLRSSIIAVKPEGFVSPIAVDSKRDLSVRTGS
jgi:nucleotide-binding universal stress UspA family protein